MAASADIDVDINESRRVSVVVTSDGTPAGTPVNISGWHAQLVVHRTLGDQTPVLTYTAVIADNAMAFAIPASDIAVLGVGSWHFYVARVDAGAEANLVKGAFTVNAI